MSKLRQIRDFDSLCVCPLVSRLLQTAFLTFLKALAASVSALRVAQSGLFSCLQRPGRRGDSHPQPSGVSRAGLRLLSEPGGLPPSRLVMTFPARARLSGTPYVCVNHRVTRVLDLSPPWRQRLLSARPNQVILGRGSGGRSLLGNKGIVGVRGRNAAAPASQAANPTLGRQWTFSEQEQRLEMTRQGCTVPAAGATASAPPPG